MDPNTDLSSLSPSAVDPEVFRRVWNRVMPDQKDCPVVPVFRPSPPQEPHRRPTPPPTPRPPAPADTGELLRRRMEQLHTGLSQARWLVRRLGSGPLLARLFMERQRAMERLAAARFLATGQRRRPEGSAPSPTLPLPTALREQFFWEQQWAKDCLLTSDEVSDPALKELFRQLARQSHVRARDIRAQLERMRLLPLDR